LLANGCLKLGDVDHCAGRVLALHRYRALKTAAAEASQWG
jgi:hypothetical protein